MRTCIASRIVSRTTLDIDPTVLRELKQRARMDRRSMGQIASELLARALRSEPSARRRISWNSQSMGARIDIDDKDALYGALDDR